MVTLNQKYGNYLWNKFSNFKLMTIVDNAETGQFLFMIMLILSSFTCS
jgi:hypothetical protein